MPETADLTHLHGLNWKDWCEKLEDHHEHLRATMDGFEGYGPRPIIAETGGDSWRQYWLDGYTPADALAEDRTYWDE